MAATEAGKFTVLCTHFWRSVHGETIFPVSYIFKSTQPVDIRSVYIINCVFNESLNVCVFFTLVALFVLRVKHLRC